MSETDFRITDNCERQDDSWPFDSVTIHREHDVAGQATGWCVIEGLRHGGAREVREHYQTLWDQAEHHLEVCHGKTFKDPHTPVEFNHAIMRAAIALLID